VERKRGHMRAIAAELPGITAPVLGRHGFAEAQLVTQWASIIGPELAAMAWPEKLSFPRGERREGTLRLRVAAGCAPEIQHRAPLLIERINAFFGYRAIVHLRLIQAPLAARHTPPHPPRALNPEERAGIDRRVATVADPDLRAALQRLGEAILRHVKE